jgi:heme/copper-type cytochrome/quinol oxidase subunit 3
MKTFSFVGFFLFAAVFIFYFIESAATQKGTPLSPETRDNIQLGIIISIFLLVGYVKSKADEKK